MTTTCFERRRTARLLLPALVSLAFFNGTVRVGADRIFDKEYFGLIANKRVGLITNQTGVDGRLKLTADRLSNTPGVRLTAVFAPEHGLYGAAQAGESVQSTTTFYSLYGEHHAPTAEMLRNVDVLIYDIQDVGARFYTYLATLLESMKAAASHRIPFIVLDRPNPIRGDRVEGPLLERGYESFVGPFAIPVRYGMTQGELATLMNSEAAIGCDLKVVPVEGWRRSMWFDETGLQWIAPSPNVPTLGTAEVYCGTCLIEGTNLSEGRGTTRPFEFLGAPWLDSIRLAANLNQMGLPGVRFRPQAFTPAFSKYKGELCQGLQVHVLDRDAFQPITVTLHLIEQVRKLHPKIFEIRAGQFDRLAGYSRVREDLLAGRPVSEIIKSWEKDLTAFGETRRKHLLY